ncbi:MAG: PH domain-containing protein [Planctomycetaceae bacterium]|nr:PH domain-containing protein [Planctomycetaceae bacterium]
MDTLPQLTDAPRGSRVAWIYGGVWGVLARGFLVPEEPPVLPSLRGEPIRSFRPAPNFLRYLLYPSLIGVAIACLVLLAVSVGVCVAAPALGLPLLAVSLPVIVFWVAIVVLAVHLRYDTTWYVLSDRSLRIRRGIWIIRETTITFENVQNVTVRQGPLQRVFGIADVLVETAGGGGGVGQHQAGASPAHQGLVEGIADAPAIRDLLTAKMRTSKSAGLGDDAASTPRTPTAWTAEHIAALREILDAARLLSA